MKAFEGFELPDKLIANQRGIVRAASLQEKPLAWRASPADARLLSEYGASPLPANFTSGYFRGLPMTQITLATLDLEIERCFPVLQELRSHLEASQFVSQIRRQEQQGYQLAYLEDENQIKAVAGFRIVENLAAGRFLYIDDLVTRETARSQGYGDRLFSWLVDYGHAHACCQLRLDSGVQRSQAHRFYFRQRMNIAGFHFSLQL